MAIQAVPYARLAPIYDRIMSHVNYKQWAKYIHNLYHFYPGRVERIHDISCGTGKLLPWLAVRNRRVFGSDLSPAMLKMASADPKNKSVPFCCGDARKPALRARSFDVTLMLYDSINYMMETKDIVTLLENVGYTLNEGGLFIFDIVTVKGCRDHFNKYYEDNGWGEISYQRKSWFDSEKQIQYNRFTIRDGALTYIELHRQKIRPVTEWEALIEKSPLEILNFYDNFSYRPINKNSERIHILCRKK